VCFRIGERSSEEQSRDSFQSVMSATSPGFRKAADLANSEIGTMSPESPKAADLADSEIRIMSPESLGTMSPESTSVMGR
jgi:hypothetical protein